MSHRRPLPTPLWLSSSRDHKSELSSSMKTEGVKRSSILANEKCKQIVYSLTGCTDDIGTTFSPPVWWPLRPRKCKEEGQEATAPAFKAQHIAHHSLFLSVPPSALLAPLCWVSRAADWPFVCYKYPTLHSLLKIIKILGAIIVRVKIKPELDVIGGPDAGTTESYPCRRLWQANNLRAKGDQKALPPVEHPRREHSLAS